MLGHRSPGLNDNVQDYRIQFVIEAELAQHPDKKASVSNLTKKETKHVIMETGDCVPNLVPSQ